MKFCTVIERIFPESLFAPGQELDGMGLLFTAKLSSSFGLLKQQKNVGRKRSGSIRLLDRKVLFIIGDFLFQRCLLVT